MIQEFEYRVRLYQRHGAMHDVFVTAPDAFTAKQKALELFPDHMPQSITRISELVA